MNDRQSENHLSPENDEEKAPNLLQVMGSVLSAFFGIQSREKRERDFKHGNHRVFIVAGIIMTLLFLTTVITVVHFIVPHH